MDLGSRVEPLLYEAVALSCSALGTTTSGEVRSSDFGHELHSLHEQLPSVNAWQSCGPDGQA